MAKDLYHDPMEAYWQNYHMARYGLQKQNYTITEVPFVTYMSKYYTSPPGSKSIANSFICDIVKDSKELDADDIFKAKTDLSRSRIGLLLDVIQQLEDGKYDCMQSLYGDIFSLQQKEAELPFPLMYDFSATLKLKEDRLKLHQEARQITQNHTKQLTFLGKDLVDSLLAYKSIKSKETLFNLDDLGEKDAGY